MYYDIANQELLAVKMAVEEWCHWLEGVKEPFLVWKDHKNLEYISSAKQLNSHQAHLALFFSTRLLPRFPKTDTLSTNSRRVMIPRRVLALSSLFPVLWKLTTGTLGGESFCLPPALSGSFCCFSQSMTFGCPNLPGRPEGVAVYSRFASQGGIQEACSQVHRSIPHS